MSLLLLGSAWALCGFSAPHVVDTDDLPSFQVSSGDLKAIEPTKVTGIGAQSAVVLSYDNDRVLYDQREHARRPQASTTKLMTALLTLERGKLDDKVTIDAEAADEPGTRMGLARGQVLTVRDLLYGLLLPSGNDAAIALGAHIGGSTDGFVAMMNQRKSELGLNDTHFANPDGLDDPDHYSSAFDLAELARFALRSQPLLDEIVRTKSFRIAATPTHPAFELTNLNQLLPSYPGADGVKTGTTPAAGQVLVGSATRDGHRIITAVMGSADRYADAVKLLDHGFADYAWLRPADYGSGRVVIPSSESAMLPAWEVPHVQVFLDPDSMMAGFSLLKHPVLSVPVEEAAAQ